MKRSIVRICWMLIICCVATGVYAQQKRIAVKKTTPLVLNHLAADFTLKNAAGDDLKLSSLRGQYVLLDCWASWCMPCRAAIPHVKSLYEKYHAAGFEVLSISADANFNAWKKAMDQEKMLWPQVVDTYKSGKDFSDVLSGYGISSVPYTILLDKTGKVIALNPETAVLDKQLATIFGM